MFGLLTKTSTLKSEFEEGIVTAIIYPSKRWRVRFEATEWFAHSNHPATFIPGDCVRVLGRIDATTLLIEPA
jgi:hypothetical protein